MIKLKSKAVNQRVFELFPRAIVPAYLWVTRFCGNFKKTVSNTSTSESSRKSICRHVAVRLGMGKPEKSIIKYRKFFDSHFCKFPTLPKPQIEGGNSY